VRILPRPNRSSKESVTWQRGEHYLGNCTCRKFIVVPLLFSVGCGRATNATDSSEHSDGTAGAAFGGAAGMPNNTIFNHSATDDASRQDNGCNKSLLRSNRRWLTYSPAVCTKMERTVLPRVGTALTLASLWNVEFARAKPRGCVCIFDRNTAQFDAKPILFWVVFHQI